MKDINEIRQEYQRSPWSVIAYLVKHIEQLESKVSHLKTRKAVNRGSK